MGAEPLVITIKSNEQSNKKSGTFLTSHLYEQGPLPGGCAFVILMFISWSWTKKKKKRQKNECFLWNIRGKSSASLWSHHLRANIAQSIPTLATCILGKFPKAHLHLTKRLCGLLLVLMRPTVRQTGSGPVAMVGRYSRIATWHLITD